MEKRNVMKSGVLWNEVMTQVHAREYKDVELEHSSPIPAACSWCAPKQFDVIVTDNLFGDMLSDIAAMLTGSLGMLPSASLGAADPKTGKRKALYEPVHGSAPDIAGKGLANPIAMIASFGMALRYSFGSAPAPAPRTSQPPAPTPSRPPRWATPSSRRSKRAAEPVATSAERGWRLTGDEGFLGAIAAVLAALTPRFPMNADAGGVSAMALLERMFAVELRFLQQDKADLDLLATAFHPDVVVHEPASLPYAGDWCGLDGIERLFRAMRATWSELSVDGLQAAMTGDTVFMTCNLRLTARSTGRPLTQPFACASCRAR
jgi:hypothetical protein